MRLALPEPQVSRQQALPGLWLRVSEVELAAQAKQVFQWKVSDRIARNQKQLLSRHRGQLFDPPSASTRFPAAVKRAN